MGKKPTAGYPRYYKHKYVRELMWEVAKAGARPTVIESHHEDSPLPRPSMRTREEQLTSTDYIYQVTKEGVAIDG